MAIIAKSEGGSFTQVEPGTYAARCFSIIDLGTQRNEYAGEVSYKRQVLIGWELPTEEMEGEDNKGKPLSISKFYTLSLHEKANLCHDLQSWRGKEFSEEEKAGFDIAKLLGVGCMIGIIRNDKSKSVVATIASPPRGFDIPEQINPSVEFSLDAYIAGDQSVWDGISDGIKGIINKCQELKVKDSSPEQGGNDPFASAPDFGDVPVDDDIPF